MLSSVSVLSAMLSFGAKEDYTSFKDSFDWEILDLFLMFMGCLKT